MERGLMVFALNSIKERSSGELPLENRIYISLVYDRAVKLSVKYSICGKLLHIRESGRSGLSIKGNQDRVNKCGTRVCVSCAREKRTEYS